MNIFKKLNHGIKNLSLKQKFLLFFGIFILIPSLCFNALFFRYTYKMNLNDEQKRISQILRLVTNNIDIQLAEYQILLNKIYEYPEVFTILKQYNERSSNIYESKIINALNYVKAQKTNMGCIAYITPEGNKVVSATSYMSINDFNSHIDEKQSEYLATPKDEFHFDWMAPIGGVAGKTFTNNNTFISCRSYIRDFTNKMSPLGLIIAYINVDFMNSICRDVSVGENGLFIIVNEDGQIIWHPDRKWLATDISSFGFGSFHDSPNEFTRHVKLNNEYYYLIGEKVEKTAWTMLAVVPQKDIFNKIGYVYPYFVFVYLAFLMFIVFCYLLIDRYIVTVMHRLIVLMDANFISGNMISTEYEIERNDEIGALYRTFKAMSIRISNLIKDIQDAADQSREKDVKMVKSRINVHFLYNTLDTIDWMAIRINAKDISIAIKCLIEILRYSVSSQTKNSTFKQEIIHLKSYLNIQKIRYEERFFVTFDIDNNLLNLKTTKFIFQPLVENSIIHGFKNIEKGGLIKIRLFRQNGMIIGQVIDNGCGMNQEEINDAISSETIKQSIGLNTVKETIKLMYGDPYGLEISSVPGSGTTVTITFPDIEETSEEVQ